ncbi:hypothetical protein [Nocardioides sp. SYSU D00038]|uniref:hypothetical protein n=1 Tax=Nocardioides sp. SYSU D00038 TaxID=2812554 RepID=UPI001966EB1D|nr:hypothetical protein [Nocardioides sp. SYSU D00038]
MTAHQIDLPAGRTTTLTVDDDHEDYRVTIVHEIHGHELAILDSELARFGLELLDPDECPARPIGGGLWEFYARRVTRDE